MPIPGLAAAVTRTQVRRAAPRLRREQEPVSNARPGAEPGQWHWRTGSGLRDRRRASY